MENTDVKTISVNRYEKFLFVLSSLRWTKLFLLHKTRVAIRLRTKQNSLCTQTTQNSLVSLRCGQMVGRRSVAWCTVTWLPNFLRWVDYLSYGAPRAWSSAININIASTNSWGCIVEVAPFLVQQSAWAHHLFLKPNTSPHLHLDFIEVLKMKNVLALNSNSLICIIITESLIAHSSTKATADLKKTQQHSHNYMYRCIL